MSKLKVGRVFLSHTFFKTKFGHKYSGKVGQIRMSIPIEVYSILNMVMVQKEFLYILCRPYGIPSFKGVLHNNQLDYQPIEYQQNQRKYKLRSKLLFKNVQTFWIGRQGRQQSTCPNIFLSKLGYQVHRVDTVWTCVQTSVVFFEGFPQSRWSCQVSPDRLHL